MLRFYRFSFLIKPHFARKYKKTEEVPDVTHTGDRLCASARPGLPLPKPSPQGEGLESAQQIRWCAVCPSRTPGSLVERELAAVRLTEGLTCQNSHRSRYLQPLRRGVPPRHLPLHRGGIARGRWLHLIRGGLFPSGTLGWAAPPQVKNGGSHWLPPLFRACGHFFGTSHSGISSSLMTASTCSNVASSSAVNRSWMRAITVSM